MTSELQSLFATLDDGVAAPCDTCRFAERCATEYLACDRFAMYATGLPESRWRLAPMAPTKAHYLAIMGE